MALIISISNIAQSGVPILGSEPYKDYYDSSNILSRKNYIAFIMKLPTYYSIDDGANFLPIADITTFFPTIYVDKNYTNTFTNLLSTTIDSSYITNDSGVYGVDWDLLVSSINPTNIDNVFYNSTYKLLIKFIKLTNAGYVASSNLASMQLKFTTSILETTIDALRFENVLIEAKPTESTCDAVKGKYGTLGDGVVDVYFN